MKPGRVTLHAGDMRERLADLDAESVDSVVTDPPYHLASIVKRFGKAGSAPSKGIGTTGAASKRLSRKFAGKQWDGGAIAFDPETWRAVWRVMKPGAHLVAFGHSTNSHRQTCAIEDAGFEIRDSLQWLYGVGYPKSHDIAKQLDAAIAADWIGWGTALKPAVEPVCLARKPIAETSIARQVAATGTGAINIGACMLDADQGETLQRWPANVLHDGSRDVVDRLPVDVGGSASRFFYCAKAAAADRRGSSHPTVKPLALMRWLVRLVTPPGGLVLDPFAGTGSTGWAAAIEDARAVLIERDQEYIADIQRLIDSLDRRQADQFGDDADGDDDMAQISLFGRA